MAVGLDNALQIAKSSLFLNQYKINVIGQNIANADNENYTRKVLVTETNTPIKEISPGSIGTGVNVKEISRVLDKFLEMSIVNNESDLGKYEISSKYLKNIESIFNDLKNRGLGEQLSEFWNAWYDLSNNPSKSPERIAVVEKAKNLSEIFHYIDGELEEQNKYLNLDIENIISKINDITKQIAQLNEEIYNIEINPRNHANDLRDKRDALVKELSKYIDVKYVEEGNNYIIFTANGVPLVNDKFSYSLKATTGGIDTVNYQIFWQDKSGKLEDITQNIRGGELKGLIDIRDIFLKDYKEKFNKLANILMTEVNKIHSNGVGLTSYNQIISDVRVNNPDISFNFEGLSNSVNKGKFSVIVYDSSGTPVAYQDIVIGDPESTNPLNDQDINNLTELKDALNNISHLNANIVNNRLHISADSGYSFAFANDSSGVLSGLGINTFFNNEKYDLTPTANIVTTEASSNTDNLYNVDIYNQSLLTNHEYEIQYTLATDSLTIKDLTTGKVLNKENYQVDTVNGHLTIKFDGIRVQLDNPTWTGDNTYYIKNIASASVYDDSLTDNHTYQINFSHGDNSISIMDLDENKTLSPSEYSIIDTDVDNDGTPDFKTIKINKSGLTVTFRNNSFGIVQIKPKSTGAKNIDTVISEEDIEYLNAGKVNSIDVDDSQSSVKVHDIQVTNLAQLKRETLNILALGGGNYQITDENGNNVTPTAQGTDYVEIDGVRINFENNTNNGDLIVLKNNLLDFSVGDNRIALSIGDLKDKKVINNNTESITENYGNLLSKIGLDLNNFNNRLDSIKISKENLLKQRDSISGVSIDEEMTKLIQTQHAYIASSKLITIIDKLTEQLINSV